jgi:GT2 family glycosyltransferase
MIDIIIPVHNQSELVKACLGSVLRSCDPARHEIVVIDDASTDADLKAHLSDCAAAGSVTLLTNPDNLGFTKTANRGMKLHADRDVILLNSDTVVYGTWVDRLHDAAYADRRIATANPLTNASHIGCYPERAPNGSVRFEITDEELDQLAQIANAGRAIDVHTTVGFCMFIKRACLREIGFFDERHFPFGYGEESDFCYRAMQVGWRHVVTGDVFVRHWEGQSFGEKKQRLLAEMLDVFTSLHPDILVKDPNFAVRDPIRPLRVNLDLARVKRMLAGRTALSCTVPPRSAPDGVSLIFDPAEQTIGLVATSGRFANLPRFKLPEQVAAFNAMLRKIGVDELQVGSAADRDAIEQAVEGQSFELGLAARAALVGGWEDGRQKSGV